MALRRMRVPVAMLMRVIVRHESPLPAGSVHGCHHDCSKRSATAVRSLGRARDEVGDLACAAA